eukprot:TRINITY_DN7007_c0_g1_i2.p2 TRINITY_DN7007_c0_g1~~TRINITY_DN7007_c0_g1_i2.p2  ORF type:complete len:110 (+),score=11.13 TRINITY_DN7007_c0_g1_i2:186-515(+)
MLMFIVFDRLATFCFCFSFFFGGCSFFFSGCSFMVYFNLRIVDLCVRINSIIGEELVNAIDIIPVHSKVHFLDGLFLRIKEENARIATDEVNFKGLAVLWGVVVHEVLH